MTASALVFPSLSPFARPTRATRSELGQRGNDRRKSGSARVPSPTRGRAPLRSKGTAQRSRSIFGHRLAADRIFSIRLLRAEGRRRGEEEEANERASERARRGEDAAKRDAKLHTGGTEGQDLPRSLCCASYVCVNPGRAVNTRTLRAHIAQSRRTGHDPTKRRGGGGGGGGGAVE